MKKLLKQIKSFLPRKLPTGAKEFDRWITDALELANLTDTVKNRQVAANFIFQIPPHVTYVPLRYVSDRLVKAAVNQVAAEQFRNDKNEKEVTGLDGASKKSNG